MKSYRKRFAGRELEILRDINEHGGRILNSSVMEKYDVKDTICWERYIRGVAEEFDFKFVERSRPPSTELYLSPAEKAIQRFIKKVSLLERKARLEKEIRDLDVEITILLNKEIVEAAEYQGYEPCEIKI
jgi:hypothetical protein